METGSLNAVFDVTDACDCAPSLGDELRPAAPKVFPNSGETSARAPTTVGKSHPLDDDPGAERRAAESRNLAAESRSRRRGKAQDSKHADDGPRELVEQDANMRQGQTSLSWSQQEISGQREQLAEERGRIEAERGRLDGERAVVIAAAAETKRQRRRLARKIRRWREAARLANEKRQRQLQRLEAQLAERGERLTAVIASARTRVADWREQKARLRKLLRERGAELGQARKRVKQLEAAAEDRTRDFPAVERTRDLFGGAHRRASESENESEQLQELRADRMSLHARLTAAEKELAERAEIQADLEQKLADTQRRFELAIGDLREYKHREAAQGQRPAVDDADSDAARLDWQAQKARILSAMQSESEEDPASEQATIEGTIRITDELLAQKDLEIAELKQVLDHQSSNLGSLAVGASAIADLFESDELIRHEREKLLELQQEWHDKLSAAEIEISLERATLARERAALEELQARTPTPPDAPPTENQPTVAPRRSSRGRWLARLGLRDIADENNCV